MSQKSQFESHTNLSDEEINAQTYSVSEEGSSSTIQAKKQKIAVENLPPSSPKTNNNTMDLDEPSSQQISSSPSEKKDGPRDPNLVPRQTPIITGSDDMNVDTPDDPPNLDNDASLIATQTTTTTNNDVTKQTSDIFKKQFSRTNSKFILLFTREQFNKESSNNEILNLIKNAFLTIDDALEYKFHKKATLEFFTVLIANEATFNKLVNSPIILLNNITPQVFSPDAVDKLIAEKLNDLEDRSIKLANVPINYDITLLIKHIANFINGSIEAHKEIIAPRRQSRKGYPNYKNNNSSPTYKQVILTFDKKSSADYLLNQAKWGILIESFMMRILPIDTICDEHKKRSSPTYIITGIPLNANALDLMPLVEHLHGKSIEILPTKSTSLHKIAHVYTNITDPNSPQLFAKFSTNFEGFPLYIYPSKEFKFTATCGYCGHDDHNIINCKETDYIILPNSNEKRFRKKFLKKSNNYQLTDDNKASLHKVKALTKSTRNRPSNSSRNGQPRREDLYKQLIPGHYQNSPGSSRQRTDPYHNQSQDSPSTSHNQRNFSQRPLAQATTSTKGKGVDNPSSPNDALIKRITHLEAIIKDLSSQINGLGIEQKKSQKDITLLQEQERLHSRNLEKFNTQVATINQGLQEQNTVIQHIPRILTILENLEQEHHSSTEVNNSQAYGTDNYAYPHQDVFVDETHNDYDSTYEDSNDGYESGHTVHDNIFPDPDYTPSRPIRGFPTITTSIGSRVGNIFGLNQRQQQ